MLCVYIYQVYERLGDLQKFNGNYVGSSNALYTSLCTNNLYTKLYLSPHFRPFKLFGVTVTEYQNCLRLRDQILPEGDRCEYV